MNNKFLNFAIGLQIFLVILLQLTHGKDVHRATNETNCTNCDLPEFEIHRIKETVNEYKDLSIIYALADIVSDDMVNSQCFSELQELHHGINEKQIWAVKGRVQYFQNKNLL